MDNGYYEDNGLFCNACHWQLESTEDRHEHYRSDWHRYNVKRRCAELPPIPFDLFHRKFEQVRKLKEEADAAANAKIICPITKREFKTQSAFAHFKNSKEYKRQVERFERKVNQADVDENGEPIERKFVSKHHYVYRLPAPEDDTVTADEELLLQRDAEAAAEEEEEEEEVVLGEDGLPLLKEGEKAIPVKYSLFDAVGPFKTVRSSLNYMMKNFNFYLPLVDYLTDVEGMLEYLGAKIGIGHQCLLCNKRFETTIGCQDHMVAQNHCMVSLSNADEEEEQEFLEYYNFAHNLVEEEDEEEMADEDDEAAEPRMSKEDKLLMKQQQRLRTLQLLGMRKATDDEALDEEDKYKGILTVPVEQPRHVVDMNKVGEIILSDGSIIGTRKRQQKYKAVAFNQARSNDQISLRNQLISQYYAAAPSGGLKSIEQKAVEKANKQYQKRWMQHANRQGMNMNLILRKHFVPQVPM